MVKSDSIIEMIQIHAYLEDVPSVGRRDFRRYHPQYVTLIMSIYLGKMVRIEIENVSIEYERDLVSLIEMR